MRIFDNVRCIILILQRTYFIIIVFYIARIDPIAHNRW